MEETTSISVVKRKSPYTLLIEQVKKQNQFRSDALFLFPLPQFLTGFLKEVYALQLTHIPLSCYVFKEWTYSILPVMEITPFKAILVLFEILHEKEQGLSLETFYPWGEILFNDFKRIKRFQLSIHDVKTKVENIQNIVEELNLKAEWRAVYKRIFRQEPPEHTSFFMESRLEYWKHLDSLYHAFHQWLDQEGFSYYEYQLEKLIARVTGGSTDFLDGIRSVHFCFFHSLSPLEEKWIGVLAREVEVFIWSLKPGEIFHSIVFPNGVSSTLQGKPSIYQIHPQFCLQSVPQVKYHSIEREFPQPVESKEFCFHQVAYPSAEGKVLQALLEKGEKPVFILLFNPDYLFPLLNSIPYETLDIEGADIYVGIPVSETPFYHFLTACLELWAHVQDGRFRSKDLLQLLKHPYVEDLWKRFLEGGEENKDFSWERILQITPYISMEELLHPFHLKTDSLPLLLEKILAFPFQLNEEKDFLSQIRDCLFEILDLLKRSWHEDRESTTSVEMHLLHVFSMDLQQFFSELGSLSPIQNPFLLISRLFTALFRGHSLFLTVEKRKKDLVVGDLEFILSHFPESVYVLNFNQSHFPFRPHASTLIPYEAFRSHSPLTPDDYFTYHQMIQMENLLTWADSVHFLFHQQEFPSPLYYILRMLNPHFPVHKWRTRTVPFVHRKPSSFSFQPKQREQLFQEFQNRGLSFSMIRTFLDCPLKFYYTYVEKWKLEEPSDVLTPLELGTILHLTLEEIKAKRISVTDRDEVENIVLSCTKKHFAMHKRHWLLDLQIRSLSQNVLAILLREHELRQRIHAKWPEIPMDLETKEEMAFRVPIAFPTREGNSQPITLIGNIDLMHLFEGKVVSIVDYKNSYFQRFDTQKAQGRETILGQLGGGTLFEGRSDLYRLYPYLQILFYSYLLLRGQEGRDNNTMALHMPFFASLIFPRADEDSEKEGHLVSFLITNTSCDGLDSEETLISISSQDVATSVETLISSFLEALSDDCHMPNENHCNYCAFQKLCYGSL